MGQGWRLGRVQARPFAGQIPWEVTGNEEIWSSK
jgi:hypothetical protein